MTSKAPEEVAEQLERWSAKSRRLLDELLEDAASELQRELLLRAVAAEHTPAEVHAFADALRPLTDDEAYRACTLEDAAPEDSTVAQLLRAEADPLFAFEVKGGTLEPGEDDGGANLAPAPAARPARTVELGSGDALAAGLAGKARPAFEAESTGARPQALDWGALQGSSRAGPPPAAAGSAPVAGRLLEDLLAEATRGLSVAWREYDVDTAGGLALAEALASAAGALTRGIPVPCAIGPQPGQHRRFVLLLQASVAGKTRAWQLYDPLSQELVWANEGDLLAKVELPFANKVNRRLTRIALPQGLRAAF